MVSALIAGAGAVGGGLLARAVLYEPARPVLTRHVLPLPGLPRSWSGARLLHLSDLHYGNPRSDELLRWAVRTAASLDPDLIVVTGDLVQHREQEVGPAIRYIAELRARRGVLAVLGDHDYSRRTRAPFAGLVEGLAAAGVRLLRNETVDLDGLRVAGVDPCTHKIRDADLDRALAGVETPHLLLSHSPDILPAAAARGVPVVLCGHTHGGQVVVPGYGPPVTHTRVHRRHASGWSRLDATRAYTLRGLASHLSLRFCCRPEAAVFLLTGAEHPG